MINLRLVCWEHSHYWRVRVRVRVRSGRVAAASNACKHPRGSRKRRSGFVRALVIPHYAIDRVQKVAFLLPCLCSHPYFKLRAALVVAAFIGVQIYHLVVTCERVCVCVTGACVCVCVCSQM